MFNLDTTIDQALGLLDGFSVIDADQRFEINETTVASDGVSPILCHPKVSRTDAQFIVQPKISSQPIADSRAKGPIQNQKGPFTLKLDGKGQ